MRVLLLLKHSPSSIHPSIRPITYSSSQHLQVVNDVCVCVAACSLLTDQATGLTGASLLGWWRLMERVCVCVWVCACACVCPCHYGVSPLQQCCHQQAELQWNPGKRVPLRYCCIQHGAGGGLQVLFDQHQRMLERMSAVSLTTNDHPQSTQTVGSLL